MIHSIKFTEDYWLSLEKKSQKRFRIKTVKPSRYSREKEPYKMFCLFENGFTFDFKKNINVIVGENGSGKSTFINLIRNYAGEFPNKLSLAFHTFKNEDEYFKDFIGKREKEKDFFKITGDISYRNTVFFDAEKDNPIVALPKMLNPDQKSFPAMVNDLFCAQEESHGESMIPITDYILDNTKNFTIFMDEPETALSLKNQIRLSKKIKESAEKGDNQIILSTHSLMIIKQFEEVFDMEARKWVNTNDYLKSIEI